MRWLRRVLWGVGVGILTAAFCWLSGSPQRAFAQGPDGYDTYYVALSCTDAITPCYTTVQAAVDAVDDPGDLVKVSGGWYTDLSGLPAPAGYHGAEVITQVLYLTKTVALRGGYDATFITWAPSVYTTTLDAEGKGRVLFVSGEITPTLSGFVFAGGDANGLGGDAAGDSGGGAYLMTTTALLRDNVFTANRAYQGGAAFVTGNQGTQLLENTVYSNTAELGGGMAFVDSAGVVLSGNLFVENAAAADGGGVSVSADSAVTLHNNTFRDNTATAGSAIAQAGGYVEMENTLVVGGSGSGVSVDAGGEAHLKHTTFVGQGNGTALALGDTDGLPNTAMVTNTIVVSHAVGISALAGSTATLNATLWGDAAWQNGVDVSGTGHIVSDTLNLWESPGFVAPETGNYHLREDSGAVDAGVDAGVTDDLDGESRPYPTGGAYDLGADEYHEYFIYLPLVLRNHPDVCLPIPGVSYEALSVVDRSKPYPPDAENDPGFNIGILGYELTNKPKELVYYSGGTDSRAPQLYTLFDDERTPVFSNVYRLYDEEGEPLTHYPVTLAGMQVAPGEIIYAADSGYDIQYGYDALVIYASRERVAFNYTRGDHLLGYTVYVDGICVEPSLQALYTQLDEAGRKSLPAVRGGDPLGRTWGTEIRVAIRDTGTAMDPRSCKDWWQGRCP